jgi:hypothetical protein
MNAPINSVRTNSPCEVHASQVALLDVTIGRLDEAIELLKQLRNQLAAVERRADDKRDESAREMRRTVLWAVAIATAVNILASVFT